jgi:RimJ/RimL family protein N-acetyltransferase
VTGDELRSARLRLRPFTAGDRDAVVALNADPEVVRFLGNGRPIGPDVVDREIVPRLLASDPRAFWAAEDRAGTFLGWLEFQPGAADPAVVELGYRLNRAAWGHGYATEGARLLIARGFAEQGVRRVTANTMAVNTRSRRVMERAGLRYVRTYTEEWDEPLPGAELGEVEYAVDADQWAVSTGS